MSKKVSVSNLGEEIQKAINKKGKNVEVQVLLALKETANKAVVEISKTAPRSHRNVRIHLADTFVAREEKAGLSTRYVIYSKEKGPLVHLVEFGFKHYGKNGKYVKGRPFMLPTLEHSSEELIRKVKSIIK